MDGHIAYEVDVADVVSPILILLCCRATIVQERAHQRWRMRPVQKNLPSRDHHRGSDMHGFDEILTGSLHNDDQR
jgi:hypothetical protein